jgi:tRNA uridine 5-carboxymethylaminomethyl modification enzyme
MFTSRAEYRLLLRADNADQRLTEKAMALGVAGGERIQAFTRKKAALAEARNLLEKLRATPSSLARQGVTINQDGVVRSAAELLSYPDISLARLTQLWPELSAIPAPIAEQLEIDGLYAGYLKRQQADVDAYRRDESLLLPDRLDYASVGGLSTEIRDKLGRARPTTLGAAARIPGVTPAALTALLRHVRNRSAALTDETSLAG